MPAARLRRAAYGLVIVGGLLADGWTEPIPLTPLPSRFFVPDLRDSVVLELPPDSPSVGVAAMYRSISHRRPLVNGYSGHTPPHHAALSAALRRGDPSVLTYFAAGRPLIVLIHRGRDGGGRWRTLVEHAGGTFHEESGLGPVYVVPPHARPRSAPVGPMLRAMPHPTGGGYIAVDLGSEQAVRAVQIELHERHQEIGPRTLVETSFDGETWTSVWEDWTGGLMVAAALEDQLRVPLRIPLPDVRARYIRISPATPPLAEHIQVFGPH